MTRQAFALPPAVPVLDVLAAAVAVAKIEAQRAHDATESLSERRRLAPLIATYAAALDRFHAEPVPSRRATHTDDGEPLGAVIEALYNAIPNSAVRTQKLADALSTARAWVYRPRYRFLADAHPGALLTDCETGETVYFQPGDDADRARSDLASSLYGDTTAQGEAVARMSESLASEYFTR